MNNQSLKQKYRSYRKQEMQCLHAFKLGSRHLVAKDVTTAIRWYERAATAGHTGAQYNLGLMYLKGEGVVRNALKGLGWIEKAVDGGDEKAQALLQRIDQALVAK